MSRIYTNGYRIEYPNALAYAGMPAIVRVSQLDTAYIGVGITIKVGENYYTETRTPYNGEVVFDISRYMQLAIEGNLLTPSYFSMVSPSQQAYNVRVVVSFTYADGRVESAHSFECWTLPGYIAHNQANGGGLRTRKWYINLPQSFDVYASDETIITLDTEDGLGFINESISETVPYTVVTSPLFIDTSVIASKYAMLKASFSEFLAGDNMYSGEDTRIRLEVDRNISGVYLRWLDHFGQWCYYLFRVVTRSYATKEVQSWSDSVIRNSNIPSEGTIQAEGFAYQQLTEQESISLGAKLVDAETFDYLLSLVSSPMVYVMTNMADFVESGGENEPLWERVNIATGTYSRTSAPLQDFTVTIARTAHKTQML